MAALPMRVKRYIVMCNAQFMGPSQVAACVKDNFGYEISPQAVQRYDPTMDAGNTLSAGLVSLFHSTRKNFTESIELRPLAHRGKRLDNLQHLYLLALSSNQLKLAVAIQAEARKQMQDLEEYEDEQESEIQERYEDEARHDEATRVDSRGEAS
jgi:hypothetical protein